MLSIHYSILNAFEFEFTCFKRVRLQEVQGPPQEGLSMAV